MSLILIHLFGLFRVTPSTVVHLRRDLLWTTLWQSTLGVYIFGMGLLNPLTNTTTIELCRRYPKSSPLLAASLGLVLPFSSSSTTTQTFLLRFLSPHPSSRRKRKSLTWALVLARIKISKGSLGKGNQLNHQVSRRILMNHQKNWQVIFSILSNSEYMTSWTQSAKNLSGRIWSCWVSTKTKLSSR